MTMPAADPGPIPKALDRRPVIWTFTMLQTYRDVCAFQANERFVAKRIPFFETPQLKRGNEVHEAMEYRVAGGKPLPESMQQWEPLAAQFDGRPVRAEPKLAIDKNWKPCDYFDNSRCWGRGRADVAIINGEMAYVGDWKTGRVKEDPFELEIQALLIKCKFPSIKKVYGQYMWLAESRAGELHDLSNFRKTAGEVKRLYDLILQDKAIGHFEKRRSGLCGFCPVEACEHYYISPKRMK